MFVGSAGMSISDIVINFSLYIFFFQTLVRRKRVRLMDLT